MKIKNLLSLVLISISTMAVAQINPMKAMKAEKEAAEKERAAELAALYEGRSETPSADVASDKANVPVKKETFVKKIERYKAEGLKIAIVLYSGKITTIAPDPNVPATSKNIMLSGSLPSIKEDLKPLATSLASKLNEEFGTDVFEMVDLKTIPYKEIRMGRADAWELTKYRTVFTYMANPKYDYSLFSGKYTADFVIHQTVAGTEYVTDKKGTKIKYRFQNVNLGNFKTAYEQESELGVKTVEQLNTIVNPPTGAALLAELQAQQDASMAKIIEKIRKK